MGGKEGVQEAFPDTPWSSVLSDPDVNSPERRRRLTELCTRYWRPVYAYVRAAWGKTIEDATDLTQAFFCHVIESDFIANFEPRHGRFRSFLKGALKHFLVNLHRDARRLKRGGGRKIVPIEPAALEKEGLPSAAERHSPEELFDLQWARDVIAQVIEKLREELEEKGKALYFRVYEAYELYPPSRERPTYRTVGEALGISSDDVKNHLTHARSLFREILVRRVSECVTSRDELMEEINDLFTE